MVIAKVQFCEGWETSGAHPVLEMLVILQSWQVVLGVTIWEPGSPVWWRGDAREVTKVGIVRIFLPEVWPCNTLIGEVVCDIRITDANWLEEGVCAKVVNY